MFLLLILSIRLKLVWGFRNCLGTQFFPSTLSSTFLVRYTLFIDAGEPRTTRQKLNSVISYAITKHHLLNVKVVAAEMLTASIVFILFIQLIFSQTSQEVIIRFLFFIIIAF